MNSNEVVEYFANKKIEIRQNGGRVWVNNSSGLIGRYNPDRGIDIHTDSTCNDCRKGAHDFDEFVEGMILHHQIDLRRFTKPQ